ncbi:MAG: hypothetical protein UY92_C0001G0049 [Candidatus Magasanikbacteria bacterium GW2011_GWA2_56_11]|uniref:DUF378 domain-containing protein n=1 Tax=Candidatus Magasanikbacteria bacterium GW2011_GWA2_56_11 TaxID=1619044 RepID=A0A0G1YIK7_9BACT|nr:MAG: hypothetical protein UY92_C0001G0049 [Candidatus Magasanikbacteria bacterium GW2011_GWA2_56_11]
MVKSLCGVHKLALVLLVVGGLNWGLVGLFDWNLVTALFGSVPMIERAVYVLVGLSAVFMLLSGMCKKCGACCQSGGMKAAEGEKKA